MESRIIKFRAWLPVPERMIDSPYYFTTAQEPETRIAPFVCYEDWRDLEDGRGWLCHIMQFTGLKDKNGIEIYEGDILKAIGESAYVVIEFKGGQFVGMNTDKNHPIQETQNRNWFQWEVIGNIYENSDLIKQ